MKICITGGTGFIGKNLVRQLTSEGHFVTLLTRKPGLEFQKNVLCMLGDLTFHDSQLDDFVANCDVLFHCAGETKDVKKMHALHVGGTRCLLKAVQRTGRKIHWVQLSSVGAYGPPQDGAYQERIVTEATVLNPQGEYETTKAESDNLVGGAAQNGILTHSILRPSNVYGPGMSNHSLISLILLIKRRSFFYIGNSNAIATYVHVSDVVSALMKCAFDLRAKGQIYNLSYDCFFEDLIKRVAHILDVKPPWIRVPEKVLRLFVKLTEGWINTPLTSSRIDSLVSRTSYPTNKIQNELDFEFLKPMIVAVDELVKECM